jgi:hypothetical protein
MNSTHELQPGAALGQCDRILFKLDPEFDHMDPSTAAFDCPRILDYELVRREF